MMRSVRLSKVLIAGGVTSKFEPREPLTYLASTELYDPVSNSFAPPAGTATMNSARYGHTATVVNNGKVLIAGGSGAGSALASTELYDPVSNSFALASDTATMNTARDRHTATLLKRGKVLIAGGEDNVNGVLGFASTELYDPVDNSFAPPAATATMNTPRSGAVAVELNNGKVLIGGGANANGILNSTEIYDEPTNTFKPPSATPDMNQARADSAAVVLTRGPNAGKVLIIGGTDPASTSTELYDPVTNTFAPSSATPTMNIARLVPTVARTGTTLLFGLLAQDPAHRSPLTWEVSAPCPPPEKAIYNSDPRIEEAERRF